MRRVLRALDHHWFAPASLRDLALVRMVVVAAQLLLFYPSLAWELWLAGADRSLYLPIPALKVLILPLGGWGARPDPMFLHAVWLAGVVAGICAIIGLSTRLSMLAFAAANTVLIAHGYSYGEFHHTEALLVISLWVLAVAPVGNARSVDALWNRVRASVGRMHFAPRARADDMSPYARWPLRVMQWLLALSYLSAGLSKVMNSGLAWFNGYTLAYYWVQDGIRQGVLVHGPELGLWLAHHPLLAQALSVGTVCFELTFALAILVPRTTWFYVLAGTAMHTTIYLVQGADFWQFIVLYVAFIEPLRDQAPVFWRALIPRRRARAPAPEAVTAPAPKAWTVMYDGLCPLCIRSMVLLDALDTRRQLRYLDLEHDWAQGAGMAQGVTVTQARHAMHVVAPDGRISHGFFAFRSLAGVLRPLWPLFALLHAPGAASIGSRIYGRIARSRDRLPCRVDTCRVS